jgi:membrane-associated phospholipid phosphatase
MTSSLHSFLLIVTDIGDSACLVAFTTLSCVYLLARRSGRAAAFLITSLVLSSLIISLLKLFFIDCHGHAKHWDMHSPSGHAAISSAVFWAFAVLMRTQLEAHRRMLPLFLLTVLIAAIAVSRVALEYHTPTEVCTGLLAGYMSLALARFFVLRGRGLVPFDAYVLALWGAAALIITHGHHLPGEDIIHMLALHAKGHVPFCSV